MPKYPAASLSSIGVATATPHSSALHTEYLFRAVLLAFEKRDIVKASMGASPAVNILLEKLFPDIDFAKAREGSGSVKIEDSHLKINRKYLDTFV